MLFPVRIAGGAGASRAGAGAAPLNKAGCRHRRAGWAEGRPQEGGLTGLLPRRSFLFPHNSCYLQQEAPKPCLEAGFSLRTRARQAVWERGGKCSGDARCQRPTQPPPSPPTPPQPPAEATVSVSEEFSSLTFTAPALCPGRRGDPQSQEPCPSSLPPKPHPCLEGQDSPGL